MAVSPSLKWDELTVRRPGPPVSDGQGGWQPGPPVEHTIRGQLQPLTVRDELVARVEGANVRWVFFCDYDADVRFGDAGVARGITMTVEGVRGSSKPGHHMRVTLEERQQ